MRCIFLLLVTFFIAGCRTPDAQRFVSAGATTREMLDRAALFYVKERRDTGAFVLLRLGDGSELSSTAGVANPRTQGAPREDTLYRLASATKILMYVVAMKLHEEGRVNLDAPITEYSRMPLADVYTRVTLRDLLNHRSGLPREFFGFWELWDIASSALFGTEFYRAFDTREKLYKALNNPKWHGDVQRQTAQYSNVGFGLLGMLLADATGEPLERLLQQYVCVPLHLADTTFEPDDKQRQRVATPCAGDLPWLYRRSSPLPKHELGDGMKAAGCVFSTPRDMARFADYLWTIIRQSRPFPSENDGDFIFGGRLYNKEGNLILYRVGMYYGSANFIGFDFNTETTLFIFRNNTDWPDMDGMKIFTSILGRLQQAGWRNE